MNRDYEPSSDFLRRVLNDEVQLVGSAFAEANLLSVIDLTRHKDPTNRDWATFILGDLDSDSPAIVEALVERADDPNSRIAAEAIKGLARKQPMLALSLVQRALAAPPVMLNVFEAAAIVAEPSLVPELRSFAKPSDDKSFDEIVANALRACETGTPDVRYL